jgi:hypothetical protein
LNQTADLQTEPYFSLPPARTENAGQYSFLIWLFVLGMATVEFSLFDVGKYSIPLIYLTAIPFCLKTTWRSIPFLILPIVSFLLAVMVGFLQGGISPMAILSQGALQTLAIFFAAGVASINWRTHMLTLTRAMVGVGLPIVVFGGYQMFARTYRWKYAFLPVTNQQAYAMGGLQRGWEKEPFTRASSVFVEPSEFGYYCLWLMLLGLTATTGRLRLLALGLSFTGIMFSQSLSAVLGAAVLLICYVSVNSISLNVVRQIAIVLLASVMAIFSVQPLIPEAFDKFYKRIENAVTLNKEADSGRVDHLPENWETFKSAPIWGQGLASISSAEANGTDVTTFTYFLMLIERGMVGTFFFLVPWVWLGWRAIKMPKTDNFRTVCILLSALNLYTFSYSSMAYTLAFWLALGICASCILRTYRPAVNLGLRMEDHRGLVAD